MTADPAVVRALALTPWSPPEDHIIDITTIGAKTGRPRRIEIWFHRVEGHFYLTGMPTPRSWYANVLANPRFTFHLKREVKADLPATATLVGPRDRRRALTAIVSQQDLPAYAARGVPRQDLDTWLARSPLIEILFDDQELRAVAATAP